MNSFLKNRVWSLQYNLSKVQSELIDVSMSEEERNIRKLTEELRYYSLLMDLPKITTFTGTQGVGKSYHVNKMCGIPSDQSLLSSLGRGEKIPVFLLKRDKDNKETQVRVYKRNLPSETSYVEFESISYQDAKRRVSDPEMDDLCLFWYADGNSIFDVLSPIAVLPGFETGTPWEMAIKIVLDLSDSVVYVTDQSRSAQEVSTKVEEQIKKLNLTKPAVVLLSKCDKFTKERIAEFAANFEYKSVPVGIVNSQKKDNSAKVICTQEQYNSVVRYLTGNTANKTGLKRHTVIETLVYDSMMYLEDALEAIERRGVRKSLVVEKAIDNFQDNMEKNWNLLIRSKILQATKTACEEAGGNTFDSVLPLIEKEFPDSLKSSLKHWWHGGVSFKYANEFQRKISSSFQMGLRGLQTGIMAQLEEKSANLNQKLVSTGTIEFDEVLDAGEKLIILDMATKPINQIKQTANADMVKILESGNRSLQQLKGLAQNGGEIVASIEPIITMIGKDKGGKSLQNQIASVNNKNISGKISSLVTSGVGAGGAALSAAEVAGAGFAGATMSVVAGVVGGAVALLATGSFLMSVTRSSNRTAGQVKDFARETLLVMSNQVQDNMESTLNRFWEEYSYKIRMTLLNDTGFASEDKNIISLARSTHNALKDCKELLKEITNAHTN